MEIYPIISASQSPRKRILHHSEDDYDRLLAVMDYCQKVLINSDYSGQDRPKLKALDCVYNYVFVSSQ